MNKPSLPEYPTKQQLEQYTKAFEVWEQEQLAQAETQAAEYEAKVKELTALREAEGVPLKNLLEKHLKAYGDTWKDVRWSTLRPKQLETKYLKHEDPPQPFYIWTEKYVYGLTYENYVIALPRTFQLEPPKDYV